MAIQVGDKTKKKKGKDLPENLDLFLPISIILFIIMGLFYISLFYLNAKAEETGEILENNIEQKEKEIPEEIEKDAKKYSNIIEDFKELLEDHTIASPFFDLLENMMHPRVMMSSIDMSFEDNEAVISGKGEGFISVGQQFYVLKTRDFISEVTLDEMSKGSREEDEDDLGDYVDFSFTVKFNKGIFNF